MRFHETKTMSSNQMDFVPREQRGQMRSLLIGFVTVMLLVAVIGYLPNAQLHRYSPLISVILIGLLCFQVIYRRQQNIDLVMTTEYQNLLFAQAVGLGTSFCIFVRRDGTIVYANDGMRNLFPYFAYSDSQLLDAIFEAGHVPNVDRERMLNAIHNGSIERLVFPIQLHTGERKSYVLTVEPLTRPSGFSVIRGREYLGTRTGTQLLPDILRATSADKLDHMLSHTPISHFTTDGYGRFEYINPAFEKLLGYTMDEIAQQKLSLHHIIAKLAGRNISEEDALGDYSGDAVLKHQNGSPIAALLFQHAVRDAQGKNSGITGSIMPVGGAPHVS